MFLLLVYRILKYFFSFIYFIILKFDLKTIVLTFLLNEKKTSKIDRAF